MTGDIRDQPRIDHEDILALNFIRRDPPFIFRPYFRNGLRSRIMAVLAPTDVRRESRGTTVDGVRIFPRARPVKMLRIFRARFETLAQALEETRRLKVVERHLAPDFIARSLEFYVDYRRPGRSEILLCGLQDYVCGVALDPWQCQRPDSLATLYRRLRAETDALDWSSFRNRLQERLATFTGRVRRMLTTDGLLPDLAGARNLLVTATADLCLVDINNIHPLDDGERVPVDDKGYPVLDKSIEALDRIDRHLLGGRGLSAEGAYRKYFTPSRRARVRTLERAFQRRSPGL